MSSAGRALPDVGLVVAARQGDQRALDDVVAASLPLVYNIVGRALNGHADVDDVVQETLLRVVRHLPACATRRRSGPGWWRSPSARCATGSAPPRRADRDAGSTPSDDVPDPASDFAEMTILRLGLTDQRREVAEATRWLDEDDQELLVAVVAGGDRRARPATEVADALGLSPGSTPRCGSSG